MDFLYWKKIVPLLEISVLWVGFYHILVFFEGTRAFQVLKGLSYLLLAFIISQWLGFETLNWLLTNFFGISIIAFMIIFQQELRQGLARLGQQHLFSVSLEEADILAIIEEITAAVYRLAQGRTGCLMALEREVKLKTFIESGILIDAKVSSELIQSIFNHQSPIHDGGIIIRAERIVAASCLFPLSENPSFSRTLGTRHRAALGITEQTDCVTVIVSEETSEISVAANGRFIRVAHREELIQTLKDLLIPAKKNKEKKHSSHSSKEG